MARILLAFFLVVGLVRPSFAIEVAGIVFPDSIEFGGAHLDLNGAALRTRTIFQVRVYAAALYLQHRNTDPGKILNSGERKLLVLHMLRNVTAEQAQDAWKQGLDQNCRLPCVLPQDALLQFLKNIPDAKRDDTIHLAFNGNIMNADVNGAPIGKVVDPVLVRDMLAVFVGDHPLSDDLKHGLLGIGG